MKLPPDSWIDPRKATGYLLQSRRTDDKAKFLNKAGYTLQNSGRLLADLRGQILPLDVESSEPFDYGMKHVIRGVLRWPEWRGVESPHHLGYGGAERRDQVPDALSGQVMKFPLFSQVALAQDIPDAGLRAGDIATIVEHYEGAPGQEPGYELEIFNALGETITVLTVRESQIEPLLRTEIFSVRTL